MFAIKIIVLNLRYIVLILLLSIAHNISLIYCFVIWCFHINKKKPCSSTISAIRRLVIKKNIKYIKFIIFKKNIKKNRKQQIY